MKKIIPGVINLSELDTYELGSWMKWAIALTTREVAEYEGPDCLLVIQADIMSRLGVDMPSGTYLELTPDLAHISDQDITMMVNTTRQLYEHLELGE